MSKIPNKYVKLTSLRAASFGNLFLRAGLIQQITITRIPVLIGSSIPLFGKLEHDIKLHHINTRHFPRGLFGAHMRFFHSQALQRPCAAKHRVE
jgi:dihydrofolate reductase